MKLEQVIQRPVSEKEADSIVKVLERLGQEKSADMYRKMFKKSSKITVTVKSMDQDEIDVLASRQKILSGIFCSESKEKEFSDPICRYLFLNRDLKLHAGILAPDKSMEGCLKYVFDTAQKQAEKQHSMQVAIRDTVVYDWVRAYFLEKGNGKEKDSIVVFTEPGKKQISKKSGVKRTGKKNGRNNPGKKTTEQIAKSIKKPLQEDGKETPVKEVKDGGTQMSLFDIWNAQNG